MALWNLGSVATEIHSLIDNIPTSISGAVLLRIIDRKRDYAERFTGQTIGSVDIALRYQDPLINLSMGGVAKSISVTGIDSESIKLGEFTIKKGNNSAINLASKFYNDEGMDYLRTLKGRYNYYKANG